jgi:hypothetical protein
MSCLSRIFALLIVCLGTVLLKGAEQPPTPTLRIPHVSRPPKLEDFLNGTPREAEAEVSDFRQFQPGDGVPPSQQTSAYLSYDNRNLYAVFVCADERGKVRGRLAKREDISMDDNVGLDLDTFHDGRRYYMFLANPRGVQLDAIVTDKDTDTSFDTLWHSEGRLTENGYVVWIDIPFKSLRFPNTPSQKWGVALGRYIRRNDEMVFWPYITQRIEGTAQQFAVLEGLEGVSPGRNMQFIPYGFLGLERYLSQPSGSAPFFATDTEHRAGLDSKLIFRDALTLDLTLNPDFSQVESDEPQVTVNQRYEVLFPEKRPFFIENAAFFQTPINLFFSRRIVDPQFGSRLTGKVGRWTLAALAMDDRAEGKLLPQSDLSYGDRAAIAVTRIQREFGQQSSIGLLFTSRDFGSGSNRVFSLDTRLKLNPNWVLVGQAMRSLTTQLDGTQVNGAGYWAELSETGRHAQYAARYLDYSPGFQTQLGFVPRVDIRKMEHFFEYYWKPKNRRVLLFGPDVTTDIDWNSQGQLQDWIVDASLGANLTGPTGLGCRQVTAFERFKGIDFRHHATDCGITTEWLKSLALSLDYGGGTSINYYPGPNLKPFLASNQFAKASLTIRPSPRLRFDESYLYTQLGMHPGSGPPSTSGMSIFNNHILRSKLNCQFTRPLSLRLIVDYNAVLPNSSLVALERTKRLTGDVLLTYMVNPGTAFYVGYTDLYENARLLPGPPATLLRAGPPDVSTGRQFFVKLSYLLRF